MQQCLYIQDIQPGEKTKRDFHFLIFNLLKMSNSIVKQIAGIDVSQKELVVCLGRMCEDLCPQLYNHSVFANTDAGMQKFVKWVDKQTRAGVSLRFVMEATGVYHESLAYFLHDHGYSVSVILPNKISNYARTLDTKTVTDKTASQAIAMFGLERKLNDWKPPAKVFKTLRQLTRERDQLVQMRTMVKNHLHAEQAEAYPNKESIARMNKQVALFVKQIAEIKTSIEAIIRENEIMKNTMRLCSSIPGVGALTVAVVVAETNGFELIRNRKQLVSYAGLDVKEKQSGTSIKGKPRISKKGNKHLRKAMHMPALGAIRHDERFKGIFTRLVSKHGIKMKAVVAVQRKILELIYTLYKTQTTYNPDYLKKLESSNMATL
jgi:transposase